MAFCDANNDDEAMTTVLTALATLTAVLHALFVLFVIAGGLLAYRWPRLLWLHLPIATYGVAIMVFDWQCPLTDLEIHLRQRAGEATEWDEFLQHYLFSHMGLTGSEWFVLVAVIVAIAVFNYRPYRRVFGRW